MIRSVKLFAIQERMQIGTSLRAEELDAWRSVLFLSRQSGFHSLVRFY
jgi:hypothetical protein